MDTGVSLPSFSVVIPVFNVANYLSQCIESLGQLNTKPIEIIFIDDGSTDSSPEILRTFEKHIPSVRILTQVNSGASVARNVGLEVATGKYLAFVDADDFLPPDAYSAALAQAERDNLDIMMFNGWYHFEGREQDRLVYPDLPNYGPCTGQEWIVTAQLGTKFLHYPWPNIYKREFLLESCLRFIPGQKFNEDVPWVTRTLIAAKRVAYDRTPRYFYRKPLRHAGPEETQRRLEAIVESSVLNAQTLDMILQTNPLKADARKVIRHQLVDGALSIFHKLKQMPDQKKAYSIRLDLRRSGLFGLLWRHSSDNAHSRRIAKNWLMSFV